MYTTNHRIEKDNNMKSQITRKALLIIITLGTLIAACSPDSIVTGPASKIEKQAATWVQDTCPKTADGHCKTMGQ
jgi:hypothetical protein